MFWRCSFPIVLLCITHTAIGEIRRPDPGTTLVNGGFEQQSGGWSFILSGANATGQIDDGQKHEGRYSYKLTNRSAFAPNVYARLVQSISGLRPFTVYKVSCWVKGKGCGINWIGGGPGWTTRISFPKGDFDWQPISFEIDAGAAPDIYELMVLSESTTEALWVDDIRLEPLRVDKPKQDALYRELDDQLADVKQKLSAVKASMHKRHRVDDSKVRLGIAVAERFIRFVETGGSDGKLPLAWTRLQLEEVNEVLDQTDQLLGSDETAVHSQPATPGKVKLKDGIFYTHGRPNYFGGYGHFDSVIQDLPNFPALGASLVQDGRAGPSSMNPDGSLGANASNVLAGLDRAARFGMRVDFLLSPHYYPDWGAAPDLQNGNIGFLNFNIFHPKAKEVVGKWAQVMAERLRDKPALHSVCLANEPVYNSSGRDPYTHPDFVRYLQQKHHDIGSLNALYGTRYGKFEEVPAPPDSMPSDPKAMCAYYDWTSFNKKMFADWHGWLDSLLKKQGLKAPTHTKIMVFQSLDRDKLNYGVDPELMCAATDLAGCDDYAFIEGAYAYDWLRNEFFYDLLHSFRGQSVFNSENHIIPDGAAPSHIPMNHSRSALWQGGLHHQGSTTIWVWEQAVDHSLAGCIYYRPANVFGAGRAMEDLNRLVPEVTAINQAKPTVALLYSQPSIFWDEKYKSTIYSLYTALNFLGQNITFVSERELAQGKALKVQWLLVPNASHVLATTPKALAQFARSGTGVLLVGKQSLQRDEYDRSLATMADYPTIELSNTDRATADVLRQTLSSLRFENVRDTTTGQSAWGIEFRVVQENGSTLLPLINLCKEKAVVQLPAWTNKNATDLLSGETVSLNSIQLEPMLPRLLKIGRNQK